MSILSFQDLISPFLQLRLLLTRYRELTLEVSRREITERYSGQFLGTFWVFAHPLFLIALYVFVFAVVLRAKTAGVDSGGVNYTAYLLAGLIPWMAFQEAMGKACHAISSNASLVKQVVFPIEVLPLKSIVTALLNQLVATALMLVYLIVTQQAVGPFLLLLPVLFVLQLLGMLGFSYFLAAVSVFVKDTKDIVQLFTVAGLYLVPVFYMPNWAPEMFKPILSLNPFSHMVWCYQDVIVFGEITHPTSWVVFPAFSLVSLILGYRAFRALKPMFGNVL
ncbi:ABC transporter permease [Pseudomonas sp. TE50-2]|uniref:ABC transporter permease n=1 Tax=Pseudomonas sp. TE50-2 TaxID=3142707 RepID=UPI003466F3A3